MTHPNMQLRRLLLDGVKIIEPYRRSLRDSHKVGDSGEADGPAIANEIALMETWIKMARLVALKLKRASEQHEVATEERK